MIDPKDRTRVFGLVYKITNLVNGKLYFGITRGAIQKRWNEHKHNSVRKKKKAYINRAIHKYGHMNFKIELYKTCYSEYQLYSSEIFFIKKYQSNDRVVGYNNSTGGEPSRIGSKQSEEARAKISKAFLGVKRGPLSLELRSRLSKIAAGRDMSKAIIASCNKSRGKIAHNVVSVKKFDLDGNFICEYKSMKLAAESVGGSASGIYHIKTGRLKTYKSFKWQF